MSDEDSILEIKKDNLYENSIKKLQLNLLNISKTIGYHNNYPYFREQKTNTFIPNMNPQSSILNQKQLRELHAYIPFVNQYKDLKLGYSFNVDGTSLTTFYDKSYYINNSILVLKDDSDNIFGAYVSEAIQKKFRKFYGDGETFLFSFYNTNKINYFPCTSGNDRIIYSDDIRLAFGCSGDTFSLSLENDFYNGYTGKTETFNNELLSSQERFIIVNLELWSFV